MPFVYPWADDGYYEDMYPATEDEPSTYRPETAIALDLMGLDDPGLDDDQLVLHEADIFTQAHPLTPASGAGSYDVRMSPLPAAARATPHMYTNLVFDVRWRL